MRDIQQDLAICAAATCGPWEAYTKETSYSIHSAECLLVETKRDPVVLQETWDMHKANAAFIAAAREALPYYIGRVQVLEAKVQELEEELRPLREIEKVYNTQIDAELESL